MQCDLVTLTQVHILSKPEKYGSRVGFQIASSGKDSDSSIIYIGAHRRRWLSDQIAKCQGELIDIIVNRVPWIIRKESVTMSGTMFYLMDIKES